MMMLPRGPHRRCQAPALPFGGEHGGACAVQADLLDASALGRLRELDPSGQNQLMSRVVTAFETSLTRLLPQLTQASQKGDLTTVRLVVHTLKSSASYLGALALAGQCAAIELLARDVSPAELDARITELLAELTEVRCALQNLPERMA